MMDSGVSGGIARDRSTTAQRSRQGSKTAAGRKRSPRERADLDGENGVVAYESTARPSSKRLPLVHDNLSLCSLPPGFQVAPLRV
jgi:hypothetical protein